MAWTPEDVFKSEGDSIHYARELIKEYEISLKDIFIPIKLRFYKIPGDTHVMFTQSHFINTPTQGGPYQTDRPWNDDLGSALHQVVSGITYHYKEAIRQGHTPAESWLEKNGGF